MIAEDYISFEVAKLLKEKGFKEPVYHSINKIYRDDRDDVSIWTSDRPKNHNDIPEEKNHFCKYSCPTIQMVMKWLREVHNLHICVFIGEDSSCDADGNTVDMWHFWSYNVTNLCGDMVYDAYGKLDFIEYQSYEEACEAAIKYCLENLI